MNSRQNLNNLQRAQHGGALILMVLILILGVAAVMMSSISTLNSRPAVVLDPVTKQGLLAAKEGLITWASMRGMVGNSAVPPGLLPYPDRHLDGNYDGTSDCASGPLLVSNAYRLGKLPIFGEANPNCRSAALGPDLNLQILDARDSTGETIWFEASRNLLDDFTATGPYDTLSSNVLATPPGTPGNWLTVCDQKGNLLSNEVAFVVIAPGSVLPGQSRAGAAAASNFLDAFALPAAGTSPCNSPTESNSDTNLVFIANNGLSPQFNDQLLYVTRQELFTRVTAAVAKQIANQLGKYADTPALAPRNVFPFSDTSNAGNCINGNLTGTVPINCAQFPSISFMSHTTDPWFMDARYTVNATRNSVVISFIGCSNVAYTYTRLGLNNYTFTYNGKRCL